ncbi:hypothetical protein NDU88_004599 [Pleurodeles waltl]|uniref:Transmembrane protein n=1 Tax=Pleurodeles waltl TaxID=8319 RepID=A0AAV7RM20_PLEWA|nr:hypothetical protein NDU88_004599 [Pleurodeles waltl]
MESRKRKRSTGRKEKTERMQTGGPKKQNNRGERCIDPGQHSRVGTGLALFLHAQRCLRCKSSCTVIRSTGCDLPTSVSDAVRRFPSSVCQFFSRVSGEHPFSASEPAARHFFSRRSELLQSFSRTALCVDFLLLGCQLLLSGSLELDEHHRAE